MKTKIFHTVNAGLYLSAERTNLLIDGIHTGTSEGMSMMPEELNVALEKGKGLFGCLHGLIFTHLHADHYYADGIRKAMHRSPETALFGPGLKKNLSEYMETSERQTFTIGEFQIFAYPTMHSGEIYKEVPHRSFLIRNTSGNEAVFIAGDAIFDPALAEKIQKEVAWATGRPRMAAAFIDIFQLIERPSIDFLKELDPERLFLYHRPEKKDDRFSYLPLIRSTLRNSPLPDRMIEIPEHMTAVL